MIKITMLALLLFLASGFSNAQDTSRPSVWAWKIEGAAREVYLLGELHSFVGRYGVKIDYGLGEKIIQASSAVWIESIQSKSSDSTVNEKLSARVEARTWFRVQQLVHESVKKIAISSDPNMQSKLSDDFLRGLDGSNAFEAYDSLMNLQLLINRKSMPLNYLAYPGLRMYSLKKINGDKLKFTNIESDKSVSLAWQKLCIDSEADVMLNMALDSISTNDMQFEKIQKLFFNKTTEVDEFMTAFTNRDDGKLLEKCVIAPRNLNWLPKILRIIESPGEPATFLFGVAHFGGPTGLLNLLNKAGYSRIQRIRMME